MAVFLHVLWIIWIVPAGLAGAAAGTMVLSRSLSPAGRHAEDTPTEQTLPAVLTPEEKEIEATKDRYVRGEITLARLEKHVEVVLSGRWEKYKRRADRRKRATASGATAYYTAESQSLTAPDDVPRNHAIGAFTGWTSSTD